MMLQSEKQHPVGPQAMKDRIQKAGITIDSTVHYINLLSASRGRGGVAGRKLCDDMCTFHNYGKDTHFCSIAASREDLNLYLIFPLFALEAMLLRLHRVKCGSPC